MTEAKTRGAGVQRATTGKRQSLKFKVDGGLKKISSLYQTMDRDPDALQRCWSEPSEFLKGFISAGDITLSKGYKQLADAMSTLELDKLIEGFDPQDIHKLATSEDPAITKLRSAVCGTEATLEEILEAGVSDDFNNPSVVVVVVMMMMTMSGSDISDKPSGPSLGLKHRQQVDQLTAHARTVADQLGWYAKQ